MLRSTFQLVQRRTFTNSSRLLIAEGDTIPNVQLQLKSPAETAQTKDLLKGKSILFGK
jgi:2-Cys peroxiredoxin 5